MKSAIAKIGIGLFLIGVTQTVCGQSDGNTSQKINKSIGESHIQANVPAQNSFDSLLQRDLNNYFSVKYGTKVTTTWEYLRKGPTQTGIAFPKYYLWIKVFDGKRLFTEGAVRIAAIEKKRFDVTYFVDSKDMPRKQQDIYLIFPQPVCEKIKSKL